MVQMLSEDTNNIITTRTTGADERDKNLSEIIDTILNKRGINKLQLAEQINYFFSPLNIMTMEHQQSGHHHSGHKHEALIQQLLACATACENCAASCLDEQDVTPMAHCIELCRDCADVCILAAKLLIRDSEFSHEFLAVCEKACRECAEECGKHEHEHCKRCADECAKCAEACHEHHGNVQVS